MSLVCRASFDGFEVEFIATSGCLCRAQVTVIVASEAYPVRLKHDGECVVDPLNRSVRIKKGKWHVSSMVNVPVSLDKVEQAVNCGLFPFPCCGECAGGDK